MLNKIVIMGRISNDLELRHTLAGKAVCSFTVAVDRDRKKEDGTYDTDWIRCVAWDSKGEFIARHFEKGKPIVVEGRMQTRDYADKDGNKRTATEIIVRDIYFSLSDSSRKGEGRQQEPYYAPAAFMPTDEDVPFE